ATLSCDYILNLKDHKQYTWKEAVADLRFKVVRSTLCARCRLAECGVDSAFCTSPTRIAAWKPLNPFSSSSVGSPFDPVVPHEGLENNNIAWTNKGESSHSSRRKPQSKGQVIRMLNVFLPGNSKLLPIEPSKVRKFEDLQSLVQDEFAIKAGSYTMRYNKSRSTTGWRPLTDACHLRTLRTIINGEWVVGSLKWDFPLVNRQPKDWECGYYVMKWMHDFILKYQNDNFPNTASLC
nr:ulp1 protease family, C-terminal catalytic domain-containing protein [Tanacetum cinerariifolium]